MTAAQKVIPFPRKGSIRRAESELAFLPAALEIVETPPSPIGRAIGVTVIALFCLALALGFFWHRRYRRDRPGQDYSERTHQGHSAV